MDTQTTVEALKEISEKYELYRDIVKIGLGALIGALASLVTVFLKNKHELAKVEREYQNQSDKHKLEIKVRIVEEVIEIVNKYADEHYNFLGNIFKLEQKEKTIKDLDEMNRNELLENRERFNISRRAVISGIRKLKLINAISPAEKLYEFQDSISTRMNSFFYNEKRIGMSIEEFNNYIDEVKQLNIEFDEEINKFFMKLK